MYCVCGCVSLLVGVSSVSQVSMEWFPVSFLSFLFSGVVGMLYVGGWIYLLWSRKANKEKKRKRRGKRGRSVPWEEKKKMKGRKNGKIKGGLVSWAGLAWDIAWDIFHIKDSVFGGVYYGR